MRWSSIAPRAEPRSRAPSRSATSVGWSSTVKMRRNSESEPTRLTCALPSDPAAMPKRCVSTVANTNDQRDQHQREKRQAPVKRDHQSERRPGHESVVGDAEHRLRHNAFDVVDVVADARHHLARAMAGVEANRLVHQAVEELLAQVEDDALADALGQIVLSEPDQARR